MTDVRIGIPSKGRLSELATDMLAQAGLRFRRHDRLLFARVQGLPIEITFLRTDDIPVLVAEQAIDLGITGSDLVRESEVDVMTRLELGVGKCKLAVCVPIESELHKPADLAGHRIATSFPRITKRYLAANGADAHMVHLSGSVEVMTSLGVADAIVDIVETGSTLAANGLRILSVIDSYQTVLIMHPKMQETARADRYELCERIARRLNMVVIAQKYSLLEYNLPADKLDEAKRITPGFDAPTVLPLDRAGWLAIRVLIQTDAAHDVMEQLEAIGAHAILQTRIENCRL